MSSTRFARSTSLSWRGLGNLSSNVNVGPYLTRDLWFFSGEKRIVRESRGVEGSTQKRVDAPMNGKGGGTVKVQRHVEQELEKVRVISKPKKTMAQLDEELRAAMEGRAGDGGESGVELEDGKPVSMKRGVRENMFRYI